MRMLVLFLTIITSCLFSGASFASSSEKKAEGEMEYVKLDPLMLPIIDEDGVYQVLSMVVVIEVDGIMDADKVKANKPRLNDAYIQNMYGILNENAAMKGGLLQVQIIKERLNVVTDEVMGDDIETEVLIQVVQQRPI